MKVAVLFGVVQLFRRPAVLPVGLPMANTQLGCALGALAMGFERAVPNREHCVQLTFEGHV